ncbi:hypothetical protein NEUTE1DRAFT_87299 [Neurospora tetrasperma FGSC 2508]|uniref:Transcription factor domain-containing protein n=1 Tax=Neurospora tetrasperma (strain FGSC 2508 / ATCC MYA-4615 / P0657) TaxID=510951 RepID=F8MWP3_NEUT8|nr:uncharacterized protein NEUTE1DRAFT_87299 [Neurospora tetrasperma FGSC 2508]EGO54164.1 hypothetical protein NEUTE1DRAFT_87299 [Neurospora tetrasperma FGSC 2508]EGZ68408.1 hypothetical protein NEUTE2DRAFT_118241 [Neurospora tetrasperma FGSC 2509]
MRTRAERPALRSPRIYRANSVRSDSGASSMFRDTREPTPKRNLLSANGKAVERDSDDVFSSHYPTFAYMDIRDLLVRHEKLCHLNDGASNNNNNASSSSSSSNNNKNANHKDGNKRRKTSSSSVVSPPPLENHTDIQMKTQHRPATQSQFPNGSMQPSMVSSIPSDSRLLSRGPACNLDLLSDAATHLASGGEVNNLQHMQPTMMQGLSQQQPDLPPAKSYQDSMSFANHNPKQEHGAMNGGYCTQPPGSEFDPLFMGDYASSHAFPSLFDGEAPFTNLTISAKDHSVMKAKLDEFSSVLPSNFVFPSRHTLQRFLEGYFTGFHDHLPFIHLPTFLPVEASPELLLAITSCRAFYRLRRHIAPIPRDHHRAQGFDTRILLFIETAQSLKTHTGSPSLWGAKAILHEALSLQSQLALLVREEGLHGEPNQAPDWESWVRTESATRTKLIAYCFFNLCSVAYNTVPLLLTSEVQLYLPNATRLWRAGDANQWQEVRQTSPSTEVPLPIAFSRLFNRGIQGPPPQLTSLGNYVLIHAILQHIFVLKQATFATSLGMQRALRGQENEDICQAIRVWFHSVEQQRHVEGFDTWDPVDSNSVALHRVAFIRLNTDLNSSRHLESRAYNAAGRAYAEAPLLLRVSNNECAVLVSKWLLTLASIGPTDPPITSEESQLLEGLRRMLDETEFAVPIDPAIGGGAQQNHNHQQRSTDGPATDPTNLRQLAAAVVRLWAETFRGTHIFEFVDMMGSGLETYAYHIENPRDRTPLAMGRMGTNHQMQM